MSTAIEIRELTVRYGGFTAVDQISLSVPQGEVFGFVGPNGAGKSSTIRTLLDLQRPAAGTISLLGCELRSGGARLRARVGYLPGDLELYGFLNGRQTLEFFADLYRAPRDAGLPILERLGFPLAALDRRVGQYSMGMRQMLGIALCFQHSPELAILDEPTNGLDPVVREAFLLYLRDYAAGGRTIFFSNHVLAEVEDIACQVALIHRGRILLIDRIDHLRARLHRRVMLLYRDGRRETFSSNASRESRAARAV